MWGGVVFVPRPLRLPPASPLPHTRTRPSRPGPQVRCVKIEEGVTLNLENMKDAVRKQIDLKGNENDPCFLVDETTRRTLQEGSVVESGTLLYLVV